MISSSRVSLGLLLCLAVVATLCHCLSSSEIDYKITQDDISKSKKFKTNPKMAGQSVQLQNCTKQESLIDCSGRGFLSVPSQLKDFKTLNFRNNSIQAINLTQLPLDTIKVLDLSHNQIKTIVEPKEPALGLERLYLQGNSLTSFNSTNLGNLRSLDLSDNRLVALNSSTFLNLGKLEQLNLSKNNLAKLGGNLFSPLKELKLLNISSAGASLAISDKLFDTNTDLITLDLSFLNLTEVPVATRSIPKLRVLHFSGNPISSLRESDLLRAHNLQVLYVQKSPKLTKVDEFAFKHLANLNELVLSGNPMLQYLSKDVFDPNASTTLSKLDLSYNNLTTLKNIFENSRLTVAKLILDGNNWHCDCSLKWLSNVPIESRSLAHCKEPDQLKDMELAYLKTIDCEPADSSSNQIVLGIISLILIAVVIVVLIQRVQFVRRLFWKDQYGSIYYTKASFPLEPT